MKTKRLSISSNLAWVLAVTVVITLLVSPHTSNRFQLDSDEGVNLAKATLVAEGYTLYSEIWSDQPPLFTFLLAGLVKVFGYSVLAARALTILFSGLLVWTSFRLIELSVSREAAIVGALLLILTDPFIRISNAVMIGLPAIALAMFAMYAMLRWQERMGNRWLIAAAMAMAVSLGIKLFTVVVIPSLLIGIFWSKPSRGAGRSPYLAACLWSGVFVAVCLLLLAIVGQAGIQQLIQPHLQAKAAQGFVSSGFYVPPALLLLTGVGVALIVMDRKWGLVYPAVWMVLAFALLSIHSPVWYHQKLLFTAPAVMVAAYPVHEGYVALVRRINRTLAKEHRLRAAVALVSLPLLLGYLATAIPAQRFEAAPPATTPIQSEEPDITLARIARFSLQTQWMATDVPMYAFRAGILIPPPIAVITDKRIRTGFLFEQDIFQAIERYRPEQVLLGRFEFPDLFSSLEQDYVLLTCAGNRIRHYIRKDLLATGGLEQNCQ